VYLHVGDILEQLDSLRGKPGVSGSYVRLRSGLLKVQAIALEELDDSPLAPLGSDIPKQLPILKPGDVPFDLALALRLFRRLTEVVRRYGDTGLETAALSAAVKRHPWRLRALIRRVALGAEEDYAKFIAGRIGVPAAITVFIARLLAAPFVVHMLGKVAPAAIASLPSDGFCPACHAAPAIASLVADGGSRQLSCSLCGSSWPFARLGCPFCGRAAGELERLDIPDEPVRWIEACRVCGHYLKTIDCRSLPAERGFLPLVEEVAGLHLNLIAEREGYRPGPPYAAMV
jgi:FdhE protein